MRIVKRHLLRMKVPEQWLWSRPSGCPQNSQSNAKQKPHWGRNPTLPSPTCHENLNDQKVKRGKLLGREEVACISCFTHFSSWLLKRPFSTFHPFHFLGALQREVSLNYPARNTQREQEASETFWVLACWPDALDEAGASGPSYNPFPASLAEVAVGPKQLIKCSIKAERKWDRNKLALNLKALHTNEMQWGLGGRLGSQS